jgi:hypothetical protein
MSIADPVDGMNVTLGPGGVMAGKLKKQDGTETLTFEVFDLDLDDNDRQRLADNPREFLTNLLAEEGQLVNDLLVSSDDKFLGPDGTDPGTSTRATASMWHCAGPPDKRSKWITVLSEADDKVDK